MNELNWIHTSIVLLLIALGIYLLRLILDKKMICWTGWGVLGLSMASLIVSLSIRSQTAQYFALSNMYESMLVLIILIHGAFLVLDYWFQIRTMGWSICLLLVALLAWDTTLPMEIHPLQAALQSYWRAIHVPVIISSYALFTLAFISAIFSLAKTWRLPSATLTGPLLESGPENRFEDQISPAASEPIENLTFSSSGGLLLHHRPSSSSGHLYDEITYRCIAFGFPLLTIGIILGGLWANEAWGNYWSWDPKESMSLVTLLSYGVYLHLRVNGEHSPKVLAWTAITGFVLMLVTYFGVNLMGIGLHSYGKIGLGLTQNALM